MQPCVQLWKLSNGACGIFCTFCLTLYSYICFDSSCPMHGHLHEELFTECEMLMEIRRYGNVGSVWSSCPQVKYTNIVLLCSTIIV